MTELDLPIQHCLEVSDNLHIHALGRIMFRNLTGNENVCHWLCQCELEIGENTGKASGTLGLPAWNEA